MRQQIAGLALARVCTFAVGCSTTIDGKAVAADKSGPATQTPVAVSALDGLLLDVSQINAALGATSMEVWFNGRVMWDWSTSVSDTNCRSNCGCRSMKDTAAAADNLLDQIVAKIPQ